MEAIVLADKHWAIGRGGDQIVRIKNDLRRFRELTSDGILIYGRKTLETFPGGRPLPGRENWLLSRNPKLRPEGARVFHSAEALLEAYEKEKGKQPFYVIGGSQVYALLLPYCDVCHVTHVEKVYADTDCFFPNLDALPEWEEVRRSECMTAGKKEPLCYYFSRYERRDKKDA